VLNCNTTLKHTLNSSHLFDFVLLCVVMMNIEALCFLLIYISTLVYHKGKVHRSLNYSIYKFSSEDISEVCTVYFYTIVWFDVLSCKASCIYDACMWQWCWFIVS
jgi:hypothetical protein